MNEVKLSKKLEEGGRRVTADLARDAIEKLDNLRVYTQDDKTKIRTITETLEQIIRKADVKTLWNQ